ncbi:hypothetical protein [Streptomyces sp. NPDC051554]|uniref:hypothetical protein n=1 Tax=Streptomyces sp. NPDC051554 TaxID=3365656 RepID=UPI00379C0405
MTADFHGAHIPTGNGLRAVPALGVGAGALTFAFASFIPRRPPTDVTAAAEPAAVTTAGAE